MVLVCHLTSDRDVGDNRNKKCLFPATTKRTTSGPSNLSGARREERLTRKSPADDDECGGCFLIHCTDHSMKKVTGVVLPEIQGVSKRALQL